MTPTDALLTCASAYCARRKIVRPTLSGLILKDSRALDRVAEGGSMTMRNYQRCLQWFSDHWPADLPWPAGVERPVPVKSTPAEAA
ncbi:MAG: hypothetical protein WDN25_13225 [Acetobacteraceae bacterium]